VRLHRFQSAPVPNLATRIAWRLGSAATGFNLRGSWDGTAFNAFNWMPVEARPIPLRHRLNIAATLVHSSAVARQHTISSQTYTFSRRGLKR
jgi:hypothetical protein